MTTPPLPPGRREDDDETGIRALLAGLGDPGPMPADLVDRINASIAAEQQTRSSRPEGRVVPLRRRQVWPRVGLAAAAVAAIAVGIPAMLGSGPSDVMASLSRISSANDSDSAASGAASKMESDQATPDAGNRAASGTGPVALAASGTAYTSSGLTSQARTVLDRGPAPSVKAAPLGAPASSEQGLRDCLTALGVAAWMPVTGDLGTYDGRAAIVAVVSSDTGQDVYAVAPDCDATHPAILAGPVPLG